MHKLLVYENSVCELENVDVDTINGLVCAAQIIKEKLGLSTIPIRYDSKSTIYIGRIVGNITFNNINLIIMPKICDKKTDDDSKRIVKSFLLRAFNAAGNRLQSIVYYTKNSISEGQDLLMEALSEHFVSSLNNALKQNDIITYEDIVEKTSSVKGKILIKKQLSEPIKDAKIWCKRKTMTRNNLFTQLLGWTCRYFGNAVNSLQLKKRINQIASLFPNQEDALNYWSVSNMRLPKQYNKYYESIEIAKKIYLNDIGAKDNMQHGSHINGYIINTEKAFECIVEKYCKRAAINLGYIHRAQATKRLAISTDGFGNNYDVIPDNLLSFENQKLIVDAKYKALTIEDRNKPSREDLYQMISSCIAQEANEAILVYPKASDLSPNSWTICTPINGENYVVYSCFINIFSSEMDILNDIITALQKTKFCGSKQNTITIQTTKTGGMVSINPYVG